MGRYGGRPSLNFSAFLAGKNVHAAAKKGAPLLDTRARRRFVLEAQGTETLIGTQKRV
jgi:hypothetical protein